MLLIIAGLATVASLSGLLASTVIKSPAERRAEEAAPAPSLLSAPVDQRILASTVILRGTVGPSGSVTVHATTTTANTPAVITGTPKKQGDTVNNGDVVLQVSGRPVLALQGAIPAYRDLKPGLIGNDVLQLQNALTALGYPSKDSDDVYGPGTKAAVQALYRSRGFEPMTIAGTDDATGAADLAAAQTTVTEAGRKVDADTRAVAAASDPTDLAAARQELQYSKEDLATARAALSRLSALSGPEVPINEVVFVPSFPASVGSLTTQLGATPDGTASLLRLDTGDLTVTSLLAPGQQQLVHQALSVTLTNDGAQTSVPGVVSSVGAFTAGASSVDSSARGTASTGAAPTQSGYPVTITPDKPLDSSWTGLDIRITIVASATKAAVLVVPSLAISTGADGVSSVSVLGAGATKRRVQVATGAIADGDVEVTPTVPGSLHKGDLVVTG